MPGRESGRAADRVRSDRLMNIDPHPVFGNKHIVRHRFCIRITMERSSVMSPVPTDYCNRIISRPLFSPLSSFSIRADWIFIIPTSPRLITRPEPRCYADNKRGLPFSPPELAVNRNPVRSTVSWHWWSRFASYESVSGTLLTKLINFALPEANPSAVRSLQLLYALENLYLVIQISTEMIASCFLKLIYYAVKLTKWNVSNWNLPRF